DPERVVPWLRTAGVECEAARPNYLRLKIGESAMVGFDLDVGADGGRITVPAYARTFVQPDAATRAHSKAMTKRVVGSPCGAGVALAPSGRTVVHVFPNDAGLPGLAQVSQVSKCLRMIAEFPSFDGLRFRKSKSRIDLVRYKPERRAILRLSAVPDTAAALDLYVRWFPDARGMRGNAIAAVLHAAGVGVAEPLGASADGRLTLERAVDGVDGATAFLERSLDVDEVGRRLAALHEVRATIALTHRRRDPESVLASALAALGTLATVDADLVGPASRLAVELRARRPAAASMAGVHGDLHLGQVLVGVGGSTFIDVERFAVGDPISDVASLVAHLMVLEARHPHPGSTADDQARLRTVWRRSTGLSDDGFGRWLGCALVEQALLAARTFEPDWRTTAAALLDQALDAVGGHRWSVIHPRPNGSWTATDDASAPIHAVIHEQGIEQRSPFTDPELEALGDLLEDGTLRSYRPGRRAVVATADGYAKVIRRRRAPDVAARWAAVATAVDAAGAPVNIPRLTSASRVGDGVLALDTVPGRSLHDFLVERGPSLDRIVAVRAAIEVVTRFHSAPVDGLGLPVASSGGSTEEWVEVLRRVHPPLADAHDRVSGLFGEPPPSDVIALVHGDLHDRNVLLDGGRGGIIDLDGVGIGDPAIDVGNLAAHVFLRALQRGDDVLIARSEAEIVLTDVSDGGGRARSWGARTLFRLSVRTGSGCAGRRSRRCC
ncbi:MAG: phosphotransferase, partial [Ilumatobacteraceae bacterium]